MTKDEEKHQEYLERREIDLVNENTSLRDIIELAEDYLFDLSGTIENVETSLEEVVDAIEEMLSVSRTQEAIDLGPYSYVRTKKEK